MCRPELPRSGEGLRITPVEYDALCVSGRRHDMTQDAFDDIPP